VALLDAFDRIWVCLSRLRASFSRSPTSQALVLRLNEPMRFASMPELLRRTLGVSGHAASGTGEFPDLSELLAAFSFDRAAALESGTIALSPPPSLSVSAPPPR
jgi:hypothetical protein